MIEQSIETRKTVHPNHVAIEIDELKRWFRTEYTERLNRANRYKYLGLPMLESRYALEMEAYEKEQRLRELEGKEPLPEPKFTNII
jgi:hypothetical protein